MQIISNLAKDKRFRRVLFMFIGFALQLWWINKRKRFLSEKRYLKKTKEIYQKQAHKFTETAADLGGLLIKLGQFFSFRVDILPEEYTSQLSKLQDAVRPVATEEIVKRIEEEYNSPLEEIYKNFSQEAVASASLGQVHTADIKGQKKVAVKVLRPGIEEIIQTDFKVLRYIVAFGKRYPKITAAVDLDQIYEEFVETTLDELDFIKEGKNADQFRDNFASDPRIYVPEIYWDYTTKRVLTMEFIDGYKISDYQALKNAGLDRTELANVLISAYVQQILTDAFFHADPHPGNLLVKDDGRLVFIDFGMMGRIDKEMRANLIDFGVAIFKKDINEVVVMLEKLGFLRPHADKEILAKGLKLILENLFEGFNLTNINLEEFFLEFRTFLYSMPFQIPAQTLFLGKSLSTVVGISQGLNPEIDFIKTLKPYADKLIAGDKSGIGATLSLLLDQAKKILAEVIILPEKVNKFVAGIEHGNIRIHLSRSFEFNLFKNQAEQTSRLISAVLGSGFLISGVILLEGFYSVAGKVLIIVSVLPFLSLLIRSLSHIRRKRRRAESGKTNDLPAFQKPRFHP